MLSEIPKSRHQLMFQCIPFCFLLSQLPIFSWILRPLGSSLGLQGSLSGPQATGSLVHELSSHHKPSLRQMHVSTHPQTTLLLPRLRDAPTAGLGVSGLLLRSPHQPSLLGRVGDLRPGTRTDEHRALLSTYPAPSAC